MGRIERELKKEIRKTKINKAIISVVAVAGTVAATAVVPNVVATIVRSRYFRQRVYQTKSSFARLISEGYITLEGRQGKKRARLTPKGERFAALIGEGRYAIKKPRRWDGKWRVLIFDIPEKRKVVRVKVRNSLKMLGLHRLQDSVWVYPYDCEDVIVILRSDLRIGKDLIYIIADKIERDAPLKRVFHIV